MSFRGGRCILCVITWPGLSRRARIYTLLDFSKTCDSNPRSDASTSSQKDTSLCPRLPPGLTLTNQTLLVSSILRNAMNIMPAWRRSLVHLTRCFKDAYGCKGVFASVWSNGNSDGTTEELSEAEHTQDVPEANCLPQGSLMGC